MDTLGLATPKQAAKMLAVSKQTITRMIASKRMPSVKIGKSRRIPLRWLHEQVEAAGK